MSFPSSTQIPKVHRYPDPPYDFPKNLIPLGKLGEGGMGSVWAVRDEKTNRIGALKTIRPELLVDRGVIRRFEREVRTMLELRHPGVVNVWDVGRLNSGAPYVLMEKVQGWPLTHENVVRWPLDALIRLFDRILDTLAYLHKRHIIHRDLKPDNILVVQTPSGELIPKLMDFGLVMVLNQSTQNSRLTVNGMVVGTPTYMAPEQACDEQQKIGPPTDLYSFGCLIYELLSGRLPYPETSPMKLLVAHATRMPDPFEPLPPFRNALAMAPIISKLLAKDPIQRFATATEVRMALRDVGLHERDGFLEISLLEDIREDWMAWILEDLIHAREHPALHPLKSSDALGFYQPQEISDLLVQFLNLNKSSAELLARKSRGLPELAIALARYGYTFGHLVKNADGYLQLRNPSFLALSLDAHSLAKSKWTLAFEGLDDLQWLPMTHLTLIWNSPFSKSLLNKAFLFLKMYIVLENPLSIDEWIQRALKYQLIKPLETKDGIVYQYFDQILIEQLSEKPLPFSMRYLHRAAAFAKSSIRKAYDRQLKWEIIQHHFWGESYREAYRNLLEYAEWEIREFRFEQANRALEMALDALANSRGSSAWDLDAAQIWLLELEIALQKGHFKQAEQRLDWIKFSAQRSNSFEWMGIYHRELGRLKCRLGRYDEALNNFKQAEIFLKTDQSTWKNRQALGWTLMYKLEIVSQFHKYHSIDSFHELMTHILNIAQETNDHRLKARLLLQQAYFAFEAQEYDQLQNFLDLSMKEVYLSSDRLLEVKISQLLSKMYLAMGDPQNAEFYLSYVEVGEDIVGISQNDIAPLC